MTAERQIANAYVEGLPEGGLGYVTVVFEGETDKAEGQHYAVAGFWGGIGGGVTVSADGSWRVPAFGQTLFGLSEVLRLVDFYREDVLLRQANSFLGSWFGCPTRPCLACHQRGRMGVVPHTARKEVLSCPGKNGS
ncbi:MAG: hypothetical protein ACYTG0_32020 [Planctomycetota bacterium]|jgi:hypothetical protein